MKSASRENPHVHDTLLSQRSPVAFYCYTRTLSILHTLISLYTRGSERTLIGISLSLFLSLVEKVNIRSRTRIITQSTEMSIRALVYGLLKAEM